MKILLTGASGFLGNRLLTILKSDEIITLGRRESSLLVDLSKEIPKLDRYDVVIHSAGKAHSTPKSKEEIKEFFDVNVNGTLNLLAGLDLSGPPKSFVFISSVAVYGQDNGILINEGFPLLAKDAYGKSKIEAEKIITTWCLKRKVILTIFRLPLIAGINPKGNLEAMINGIKNGYYFNIDKGRARKSIVFADDIGSIIKSCLQTGGIYNLTDGYHPSFYELSSVISKQLNKPLPKNIPLWLAKVFGYFGDIIGNNAPINSNKVSKITSDLTFDDTKARTLLNWHPKSVLDTFKIS